MGSARQTFDAVLVSYQRQGVRLTAFGAFAVAAIGRTMARSLTEHRLSGLYGSFDKLISGTVIEPYVFWKSDRGATSRDVVTYGVRTAGALPGGWTTTWKWPCRGDAASRADPGLGGALGIGRPAGPSDFGPRLSGEYNFGSGDGHRRRPGR